MPFSPRQTGFLGAARTLDSYSGWSDDEISNNINEVLSSGDQNRISGLSSALGGLGSYEGWQPEEIQSNITEIFKPAPITHQMPSGETMEGPEHPGAIPGSETQPLELPPAPEQLPPTEIPEPTLTMPIPEEPVGEFQLKQDFPGYQPEFPAETTKQLPIEEGVDIQPIGTLKEGTKQVGRTGAGFVKGLHEAGRETLKKESAKMDEYAKQAEARGDFKYAKYLREQIAPALKEESDRLDKVSKVADKVLKSEILKTDPEWKKATGLKGYVQDVIMMVPQLAGQIGATTLTGGVGGIMFMGVQIAGGQYEDLIAKGVEPERAFGSAMVNAAIQAPLEQISLKFMTKLWKPGGKLVENLVGASTAAGSEFLTEWVQKYPELATDIWATTKGESLDKRMKEFGRRVGEVTKEGIYEGLVAAPLGFLGGAAGKTGATIAETVPPTQKPTVQDLETTLPGISQAPEVVQEEPDLLPPMQEPTVSELETVSEPKTVEPIVEEKIKKAEVAPEIGKIGEGTEAAKDRRKDLEKRKRIEEMSPEEMIQALSVDELTGSMSTRKWNDIEKLPAQGTLDVDGLKWFNDKMGHDSGDMLLKEIVKSMQESGVEIARIGEGDEFRFQEKNVKDIDKKVKNAYNILKDKTIEITKPDGSTITVKGLGFSYGTAENADYEAAKLESDQKLNEHKLERESAGLRGGRAKEPPGVSRQAPEGVKDQPDILEPKKPELGYESNIITKFEGRKYGKVTYAPEHAKLSTEEKHAVIAKEKKLIDTQIAKNIKENVQVRNQPLRRLKAELNKQQKQLSAKFETKETPVAKKGRLEKQQLETYAKTGKAESILTKRVESDVKTVIKEVAERDIPLKDLNKLLTIDYDQKQLQKAIDAIKKGNKDGMAAMDIRKEIGGYLAAGTNPEQVADMITDEAIPFKKQLDKEVVFKATIPEEVKKTFTPELLSKVKYHTQKKGGVEFEQNEHGMVWEENGRLNVAISPKLSADQTARVLFHEIGGHVGALGVIKSNPKIYNRLNKIYNASKKSELAQKIRKNYQREMKKDPKNAENLIFSEWVAYNVEDQLANPKKRGAAYHVVKAVKQFLIDIGISKDSVDDVMRSMVKEIRKVKTGEAGLVKMSKDLDDTTGDLFAGTKLAKDEKATLKALEKAEVKLRQKQAKGGRADVTGLPMFKGKEIEGTEQLTLFSKNLSEKKEIDKRQIDGVQVDAFTGAEYDAAQAYESAKDAWIGEKDVRILKAQVEKSKLQKRIKNALGLKSYTNKAKLYDQAIQIYIDSKRSPGDFKKFKDKLSSEQKYIYKLSQELPPELKKIADEISESYQAMGFEAAQSELIKSVLDNYAGRIWELEEKKGKPTVEAMRKFGTKTGHAKARKFATIIEGQAAGYNLKVKGATNNLQILKDSLVKTIEDKRFLKSLQQIKTIDGDPLVTTEEKEDYVKLEHPNLSSWKFAGNADPDKVYGKNFFAAPDGTLLERRDLYAPKAQAKNLNNILGVSRLKDVPGIKQATKYNAIFKAWILQSSFFHHLAFMRSYELGTLGKKFGELSPIQATKQGIKAIESESPIIQQLVRNGLTLGLKQDWNEELLQEKTIIGKILDKTKATKVVKDKILDLRERQAEFLFGTMGAGLKAKAAMIEYRNIVKHHPNMDTNRAAKMAANLINDDFGGLHLQRMGRNPTLQHIFRFFALAPDWTESNIRSMVKMVGAGTKEERAMYRRFWAGIATKGVLLTVAANALFSIGAEDEDEKFFTKLKRAWGTGKDWKKLKWLDVDITNMYKALGGKSADRKYFSIIGHFKDPLKFATSTVKSAHHKGSVIYKTFFELLSGEDWAGRRFTTLPELLGVDSDLGKREAEKLKGKTVTWKKGGHGGSTLPSYLLAQARGLQPVQVQNLISYVAGEMEGFDALMNSMGLGVRTTYGGEEGRFAKNKRRIKKVKDEYKYYIEKRQPEKAKKLIQKNKKLFQLESQMKAFDKKLRVLKKARDFYEDKKDKKKVELLTKKINEMLNKFNKSFDARTK